MKSELVVLQNHSPRFATRTARRIGEGTMNVIRRLAEQRERMGDGAAMQMGAAYAIVGILIAVLVFGSVSPSISTGLNNTKSAFAHVTGVSGILDVLPILLVVGVLFSLAVVGHRKGYF